MTQRGRWVLFVLLVVMIAMFARDLARAGEKNDGLVDLVTERVSVEVPAWQSVLIGWINSVLPGLVLIAVIALILAVPSPEKGVTGGKDGQG